MRWISVEDELPKVLTDIIATDGINIEFGFRSSVDNDNKHNWCDFWFPVTHWMLIPDGLPEEEIE